MALQRSITLLASLGRITSWSCYHRPSCGLRLYMSPSCQKSSASCGYRTRPFDSGRSGRRSNSGPTRMTYSRKDTIGGCLERRWERLANQAMNPTGLRPAG